MNTVFIFFAFTILFPISLIYNLDVRYEMSIIEDIIIKLVHLVGFLSILLLSLTINSFILRALIYIDCLISAICSIYIIVLDIKQAFARYDSEDQPDDKEER